MLTMGSQAIAIFRSGDLVAEGAEEPSRAWAIGMRTRTDVSGRPAGRSKIVLVCADDPATPGERNNPVLGGGYHLTVYEKISAGLERRRGLVRLSNSRLSPLPH